MGNLFCCVRVDKSTVAFKEKFGKFEEVLEPGCHFLPWILGYRLAGKLSFQLQQLHVNCKTKTKDNEFVNVFASVQFHVLKAIDAFYKLSNVDTLIETYVIHGIRASVPKLNLDDALVRKNEIAKAIEEELEKVMSDYGYVIVETLIVAIVPDLRVRLAISNINFENREMILQIERAQRIAVSNHLDELIGGCQHHAIVDTIHGFAENIMTWVEEIESEARDLVACYTEDSMDLMAQSSALAREISSFALYGK